MIRTFWKKATFSSYVITTVPEVKIQVQNEHGVLSRLVLCLKCMKLAAKYSLSILDLYIYFRYSKNDDEKRCFLKWFGLILRALGIIFSRFSFVFLEELRISKFAFEIYWPLGFILERTDRVELPNWRVQCENLPWLLKTTRKPT